MAFAPVLNEFCDQLKCSNTVIAKQCGMSMSSLSRYRHGQRTPGEGSPVIAQLAKGISELARERGIVQLSLQSEIEKALMDSITVSRPLGSGFASRLDGLMKLLSIRNAEIALPLHLDASYISRIRRGERTPQDKDRIAAVCAQAAGMRCLELDSIDKLSELFGDDFENLRAYRSIDLENVSSFCTAVRNWLAGNKVMDSDVHSVEQLLENLNSGYYESALERVAQSKPSGECAVGLEPRMRFYRGEGFMWKAELSFMRHALQCGAQNVIISNDMPALETRAPAKAIAEYEDAIVALLGNGCKITVLHSIDRPLAESLRGMSLWIPMYMTGNVKPLYLSGMESRLFCHANNVCECCAMTSEAIRGLEGDGQYFISTRSEDIAYYQKKMNQIMSRASSLLEIYRNDDAEGMVQFEREEAERQASGHGRRVCADRFENLEIISYSGELAVISLNHPLEFRFVTHHPKLCYALSHL